jgi:hypothetical protein
MRVGGVVVDGVKTDAEGEAVSAEETNHVLGSYFDSSHCGEVVAHALEGRSLDRYSLVPMSLEHRRTTCRPKIQGILCKSYKSDMVLKKEGAKQERIRPNEQLSRENRKFISERLGAPVLATLSQGPLVAWSRRRYRGRGTRRVRDPLRAIGRETVRKRRRF